MGYAILTATFLLLIQYGKEGAAVTINSNSNGNVKSGNDISLDISYTTQGLNPIVYWAINGTLVAQLDNNVATVLPIYTSRLSIIGNGSLLLSNSTKKDTGNYTVTVTALGETPGTWNFEVTIYDPGGNVTVKQSLQVVSENTSAVNLSCSASSGYNEAVIWMKDGQSITNNSIYNLLDGNQTLQIMQPNRTFSGNYSCNISNAVYWSLGYLQLRVYDPVVNVTVTQSPQKVNEGAAFVNLSCSSSSGYTEMVTWMKDGQSVISKNAYSLLDGNWTLQITQPDRTFNGLYICNVSNAAYWGSGSLNLTVSYATLRATSTYSMMIITLLGGIMLAH